MLAHRPFATSARTKPLPWPVVLPVVCGGAGGGGALGRLTRVAQGSFWWPLAAARTSTTGPETDGSRPRHAAYYAVAAGRQTGVFTSWDQVQSVVSGFRGANFKKFATEREAAEYCSTAAAEGPAAGSSSSSSTSSTSSTNRAADIRPWYAIAAGDKAFVLRTWDETRTAVNGVSGASYKRFDTEGEAEAFLRRHVRQPDACSAAASCGGARINKDTSSSSRHPLDARARQQAMHGPHDVDVTASTTTTSTQQDAGSDSTSLFYYAVAKGRTTGVFTSWEEASVAVDGFTGAKYKRFSRLYAANTFVSSGGGGIHLKQASLAASPSSAATALRQEGQLQPATQRMDGLDGGAEPGAFAGACHQGSTDDGGDVGGGGGHQAVPSGAAVDGAASTSAASAKRHAGGDHAPPIYYAVAKGRKTGVFTSWEEASAAVDGFTGALYKEYKRLHAAEAFVSSGGSSGASAKKKQVGPTTSAGAGAVPSTPELGGAVSMSAASPKHRVGGDNTQLVYYAVAKGKKTGVFTSWEEASAAVNGFTGAKYKKYKRLHAAEAFVSSGSDAGVGGTMKQAAPPASPSAAGPPADKVPQQPKRPQPATLHADLAWSDRAEQRTFATAGRVGGSLHPLLDFSALGGRINPAQLYRLEFDGGSRRNPGDAGFGAVLLEDPIEGSGRHVEYVAGPLKAVSNNVAEWTGLAAGLEAALQLGVQHILVAGDSQLVCRQVSGQYGINMPSLQPLASRVALLKARFKSFELKHIPRELNSVADALSNLAMDAEAAVAAMDSELGEVEVQLGQQVAGSTVAAGRGELDQILKGLGEPAVQAARTAAAASAAALLSTSTITSTSIPMSGLASKTKLSRGVARGSGGIRCQFKVEILECPPPLAARGSAIQQEVEFRRCLIALACEARGLLAPGHS